MKRIHILVEGQTEEAFARDILRAHFLSLGVWLSYSIVATKRTKKGTKFKGGFTSYQNLKKQILLLLRDTSLVAVTTMIDYYGIPDDFPGKATLQLTVRSFLKAKNEMLMIRAFPVLIILF